jgi:RHS repeat-associated protein
LVNLPINAPDLQRAEVAQKYAEIIGVRVDFFGITTKQTSGSSAVTVASSITYKPFGPLAGLTFGNGLVLTQGYDQDYQLTGIGAANGGTTIQYLTNGFDPAGNITSITDGVTSGRSQTVTYDNLNRVLTASGIYGSQTYAYDGVGNRQSLAAGSTSTYTYASAANQVASITNMVPPATATGTYLYNAFRQRVQKVSGGVTTQFVYDQAGHLLEEANGSGTVQREYIWLDDMPVAMVDRTGTPTLYFIHADQIGTSQKLTDGSMAVVWDGVFDPFGNPASGASLAKTNLRFPGQYFDGEARLNQNWNRDYDPTTGRYMSPDSVGIAEHLQRWSELRAIQNSTQFRNQLAGLDADLILLLGSTSPPLEANPYTYVVNNPLRWTDRTGESISSNLGGLRGLSGGLQCSDPKKQKNCAALRDNIINQTCKSIRNPKAKMACFAAAWTTYLACLSED